MLFTEIAARVATSAALFAYTTTAMCSNLTLDRTYTDTPSSFGVTYTIPVSKFSCSSNATKPCRYPSAVLRIVAKRELLRGLDSLSNLSMGEEDAIFNLASQAYFEGDNTTSASDRAFVTLEKDMKYDMSSIWLTVPPGYDGTLGFVSFHRNVYGVLSDCTDTSLNNLSIRASAPYMMLDRDNQTVLAGTWGSSTDKRNSAAVHGTSALFGITLAAMVSAMML